MQQPFCRAAKELVLRLIRAVSTKDEAIDVILPNQMLNFNHRATCHHDGVIGNLGSELTLTEGLKAFVCFRFKALLQFGKRRIREVNPCEIRQVVNHVDH